MSGSARSKYPLYLPASLKEAATRLAKNDGVSLNQWITAAVAQKIGAVETADELLARRAAEANPGDLIRYLDARRMFRRNRATRFGTEGREDWLLSSAPPDDTGMRVACPPPSTRSK